MARPPFRPPQNLLDKAIAYVSPERALQRARQRSQLALSGAYTGARLDRAATAAWATQAGGSVKDVVEDLPTLRDRSADLERNNPIAAAIVDIIARHAVGTGLSLHPQIDADALGLSHDQADAWQQDTRRRFKAWAESKDCSLDRSANLYGLQQLWIRAAIVRGDVFITTPQVARGGLGPRLALQTFEADRVYNPSNKRDTDTLTDGIEHSAETGEAVAYHFASRARNDLGTLRTWQTLPARGNSTGRRNVLHAYRPLRPGLRRGVPLMAPVIEQLKQLSTYAGAELSAAVNSALFPLFAEMDPAAFDQIFGDPMFSDSARGDYIRNGLNWSGEIESGKVINTLPGEKIYSPTTGRPNPEFDPFWQAGVAQVGMAVGLPKEVLLMLFSSSYTAARGALLMAWRTFYGWRDWLAFDTCQPVYETWLADEVAQGRIAAPGFFAPDPVVRQAWCGAQWIGDGPGSIDPGKEVAAAKARVELEISTLQAESILHDGVDWETKHRQRVKELEQQRSDGTLMASPGQAAIAAPAQAGTPPADEVDDAAAEDDQDDDAPAARPPAPRPAPRRAM